MIIKLTPTYLKRLLKSIWQGVSGTNIGGFDLQQLHSPNTNTAVAINSMAEKEKREATVTFEPVILAMNVNETSPA